MKRVLVVMAAVLVAACGSSKKSTGTSEQEAKCIRDCEAARPQGAALYESFRGCIDGACKGLDPDSEEGGNCFNSAFDPANAQAACKAPTGACFSGPIAGCKALLEWAEDKCEPETLPVTDEMAAFELAWCLISSGWSSTVETQARAWALYQCAMNDPPDGCIDRCMEGRGPCRACAAEKCGDLYDACLADSAPFTGDPTVPADKQACQDVHTCVNFCLP